MTFDCAGEGAVWSARSAWTGLDVLSREGGALGRVYKAAPPRAARAAPHYGQEAAEAGGCSQL